jgi:hypothetical protein
MSWSSAPGPAAFSWGSDNSDVVLRAYGSVAVHENPYGDIVIRQERDALEEDDSWVVVPVQDAELVAQAIVDKAKEIKAAALAERQRQQQPTPEDSSAQPRLALPSPAAHPTARPTIVKRGVA